VPFPPASDRNTQRPFAIVIVAGPISWLFVGFFVDPVLYDIVARYGDVLQVCTKTVVKPEPSSKCRAN
jgi:hypothetical protein